MTIKELKSYIFENNKIEFVLDKLGCHQIQYHKEREYYSAAQPDGDNPQGVNIKNNAFLDYRSFTRDVSYEDGKDLIDLAQTVKKLSFVDTVKYLHTILGIEYKWSRKQTTVKDKSASDKERCRIDRFIRNDRIDVENIRAIEEEALNDYVPLLYVGWFREGIMPWTRKKFGIAYSYRRKRIIIPMRYWLTGQLLGINSRTIVENYDELGIKKFFITPTYQKSLNLYGLYENHDAICQAGYVVIHESEKSVLKRDSRGDDTSVALSGKTISSEQVRILLGLNVDIIVSLDNDVPLPEIWHICEKFYGLRNVYYIQDDWGLLGAKDAAADKPDKIYSFLLKHKKRYGEKEHKEYLKLKESKHDHLGK